MQPSLDLFGDPIPGQEPNQPSVSRSYSKIPEPVTEPNPDTALDYTQNPRIERQGPYEVMIWYRKHNT